MRNRLPTRSRRCQAAIACVVCLCASAPGTTAPANGQPFAYFGHAVAISGDAALVGAYRENGTGAAYVYVRENGEWRRQARLVAADGEPDDFFGWSVALEGDLAVVGAPTDDIGGLVDRGSIYAFRRTGDRWSLDARLVGASRAAALATALAVRWRCPARAFLWERRERMIRSR